MKKKSREGAPFLFVDGRLRENRDDEAQQLLLEGVPGDVDTPQTLSARDDDATTGKDEHDDGGVLRAVDEAREHAALERALDVVLLVEAGEVDVLALEVHVDVADDVLHLYAAALEVDEGDGVAEEGDDLVRGEDAEEKVAAAGEHHLPGREEEDGAVRFEEADGDGRELFLLEAAVGEDAVDELEVEGEAAAEHLGGADDVVHHDGGLLRHVARLLGEAGVVEVDVARDALVLHGRAAGRAAAAAHAGARTSRLHTRCKFIKKKAKI